jgi:hypothetical protein
MRAISRANRVLIMRIISRRDHLLRSDVLSGCLPTERSFAPFLDVAANHDSTVGGDVA